MSTSTSQKCRPMRTGARGGSRTGHKSYHYSKSVGTNGSKSSTKQVNCQEQEDPSRPRSATTSPLAGRYIAQGPMLDQYLSCKTSATSSYRLGKSIPDAIHSGHEKILKVTENVRKLSFKSTSSRQVITCTGAEGTIKVNKCDTTASVVENKQEYLSADNNSNLAVVASQNGDSPELVAYGDYMPSQFLEQEHHSSCRSGLSGVLDTYGQSIHPETSSRHSDEWTKVDWSDSDSDLISDVLNKVREGIKGSGIKHNECFIKPPLTPMMQAFMDRITKESRAVLKPEWSAITRQCPIRSSAASTRSAASTNYSNGGPSGSLSTRSSLVTNGKLARGERDDVASDSDEEKPPNELQGFGGISDEAELGRKFACPFHKHDPSKYLSCALKGFDSISRVKEHLYRSHRAPIHCRRCHMQFSSVEELDRHSLVPQIEVCELRQDKITEGLTLDMEKLIRVRKRIPRNQTDEECWMAIYRLLFPKDETVPGPYFDPNSYQDLAGFKNYSRAKLPRIMNNILEAEFNFAEDIKNRLLIAMQECQESLFSEYDFARRQSQTSRADSEILSHYQAENAITDESQRPLPVGQAINQLTSSSQPLPQPISNSSSIQDVGNFPTIVEENSAYDYMNSGFREGVVAYPLATCQDNFAQHYLVQETYNESHVCTENVQLDMVGANNGICDESMLEMPPIYPEIPREAPIGISDSEYGWDSTLGLQLL